MKHVNHARDPEERNAKLKNEHSFYCRHLGEHENEPPIDCDLFRIIQLNQNDRKTDYTNKMLRIEPI